MSDAVAAAKPRIETHKAEPVTWKDKIDQLWKGWLLPRSEEDIWFVAGSAEYYRVLQSADVDGAMHAQRIRYRGLRLSPDDAMSRFRMQQTGGV